MISDSQATVGVIVPMYNAAHTIGITLKSILGQTHRSLDVIVVDDGSTDASPSIVAGYARSDERVRLIRQPNLGVAAARNLGAASTDSEFLAFIDADDLWAPSKIALQLQALEQGGPSVGLAYCWFAQIDEDGRVISLHNRPRDEGWVLRRMCRHNFIGNGSSMLLRRSAFEAVGKFDPLLRERGAQGCEDLLMGLRVAERFEFRVVPRYLVGYRVTETNMSSDVVRMLRSCEIVLTEFAEKYPEYRGELDAHLTDMLEWLAVRALMGSRFVTACQLLERLIQREPRSAISRLPGMLGIYLRGKLTPRWVKAGLRRLGSRKGKFRPPFGEMVW
jgi:glycosyltransferase involved in cell wall biosynthesis